MKVYQDNSGSQIKTKPYYFRKQLKIFPLWVFLFDSSDIRDHIIAAHKEILKLKNIPFEQDRVYPVIGTLHEAKSFFKTQTAYFKIFTDFKFLDLLTLHERQLWGSINQKIAEIHIFYGDKYYQRDKYKFDKFKESIERQNPRIKICMQLEIKPLLSKIQDYLSDCLEFIKITGQKKQSRFPSYIPPFQKLNGKDKSEITKIRRVLYAMAKLNQTQKIEMSDKELQQQLTLAQKNQIISFQSKFLTLAQQTSKPEQPYVTEQEKQKFLDYLNTIKLFNNINNLPGEQNRENYFKILKLYSGENFYYNLTNNMLRIAKQVEDFKYVGLPFNQIYNSIKYFYDFKIEKKHKQANFYELEHSVKNQKTNEPQNRLFYRGTLLMGLDSLKPGDFIQFFGFLSSSQDQNRAKDFILDKGYGDKGVIIVISLASEKIQKKWQSMDHGFIVFNQHKIPAVYQYQQQVLFNAMNVFEVIKHEQKGGLNYLYLKYGGIFQMLQAFEEDPEKFRSKFQQKRDVVINYLSCKKEKENIIDLGDVYDYSEDQVKASKYREKRPARTLDGKLRQIQIFSNCGKTQLIPDKFNLLIESIRNNIEKGQLDLKQIQQKRKHAKVLFAQFEDPVKYKRLVKMLRENKSDNFQARVLEYEKGSTQIEYENRLQVGYNTLTECKQNILLKIRRTNQDDQINRIKEKNQQRSCLSSFFSCFKSKQDQYNDSEGKIYNFQLQIKQQTVKWYQLLIKVLTKIVIYYKKSGLNNKIQQEVQKGKTIIKIYQQFLEKDPNHQHYQQRKKELTILQSQLLKNSQDQNDRIQSMTMLQAIGAELEKSDKTSLKRAQISGNISQFKLQTLMNGLVRTNKAIQISGIEFEKEIENQSGQYKEEMQRPMKKGRPYQSQSKRQEMKRKCQESILKNIQLQIITKAEQHPDIAKAINLHASFLQFNNQPAKAFSAIEKVMSFSIALKHSQGAKAKLTQSKVFLSIGSNGNAFKSIEQALKILTDSFEKLLTPEQKKKQKEKRMLKKENDKAKLQIQDINYDIDQQISEYLQNLRISELKLEIRLIKAKIYGKQLKHDLALKQIAEIEDTAKTVFNQSEQQFYLIKFYEEKACIEAMYDINNFETYSKLFNKVIELRTLQKGQNRVEVAICHYFLADYLLRLNRTQEAQKQIKIADQILEHCSSINNLNQWISYLRHSELAQIKKNTKQQIRLIKISSKIAEKRFSKNHINYLKIKVQQGRILMKSKMFVQANQLYRSLSELQKRLSIIESSINPNLPIDDSDEKIKLRSQINKYGKKSEIKLKITSNFFNDENPINPTSSRGQLHRQKMSRKDLNTQRQLQQRQKNIRSEATLVIEDISDKSNNKSNNQENSMARIVFP